MLTEQLEFEFGCPLIEAQYYRDGAEALIQKLVPADLLDPSTAQRSRFADLLPIIEWSELNRGPTCLSGLLLCKYRHNACQFFYEMISRWLLPQKRLNVELFFASDVRLPHLSEDLLSVAEVVIYLKSIQDVEEVKKNLKALEAEIRLGIVSHYHARRILEFKGLSSDGKTAMIQERISSLIQNRSKDYDREMFAKMQQFLVNCPEELKGGRDYHHLSRMISNLYSIQKMLEQNSAAFPSKRHIIVKFLKTRITREGSMQRPVLGILVGLNFLREHEIFDENHLVRAIQQEIPSLRGVKGSFFAEPMQQRLLQTVYLEVEKESGVDLTLEEVQRLRLSLPNHLKNRIEQLTRPVFMPRNEEEVLRNIMTLAQELRSVHDLPQVILTFDAQTAEDLSFTVIFLRIREEGSQSIEEVFAGSPIQFSLDRVRKLSLLRRKYFKEASVFRATFPAKDFLRIDQSVDLYQARQTLLLEIMRRAGDVRDYNGGIIFKQNQLIASLKEKISQHNHLLLEQFFFALEPVELRAILDEEPLKQWFSLLLQASKKEDLMSRKRPLHLKQEDTRLFAILICPDEVRRKAALESVHRLALPRHQLISFSINILESTCLGFLLFSEDKDQQQLFADLLRNHI